MRNNFRADLTGANLADAYLSWCSVGEEVWNSLDGSILTHHKLLLVLSDHSVFRDWVESEVIAALAQERQQNETILFPIRLDDTLVELDAGWAVQFRDTRHIYDFRAWQDQDAYQQAFTQLLSDLRAE